MKYMVGTNIFSLLIKTKIGAIAVDEIKAKAENKQIYLGCYRLWIEERFLLFMFQPQEYLRCTLFSDKGIGEQ